MTDATTYRLDELTGDLSPRQVRVDSQHVDVLEAAGGGWPPILVWPGPDGLMIVDGVHRVEAARRLGWDTIDVTVFVGDETAARLAAYEANATHGKQLTLAERKAWARQLVGSSLSNREIGRRCGLGEATVRRLKNPDHPGLAPPPDRSPSATGTASPDAPERSAAPPPSDPETAPDASLPAPDAAYTASETTETPEPDRNYAELPSGSLLDVLRAATTVDPDLDPAQVRAECSRVRGMYATTHDTLGATVDADQVTVDTFRCPTHDLPVRPGTRCRLCTWKAP